MIVSGGFQLILTKNQVQLRFLVQLDVVGTQRWSKTAQRPHIPLVWYLLIGNWTDRSEIMIGGLKIFQLLQSPRTNFLQYG